METVILDNFYELVNEKPCLWTLFSHFKSKKPTSFLTECIQLQLQNHGLLMSFSWWIDKRSLSFAINYFYLISDKPRSWSLSNLPLYDLLGGREFLPVFELLLLFQHPWNEATAFQLHAVYPHTKVTSPASSKLATSLLLLAYLMRAENRLRYFIATILQEEWTFCHSRFLWHHL